MLAGEMADEQPHQQLMNLQAVHRAEGFDLSHVAKTTFYLCDIREMGAVNDGFAQYFVPPN
jgi:enamine deaminase RidA (YjgF/YER057c/UK114 family)